jgi:hypothetical protein
MLKENFQSFIYTLFFGVMIVYILNIPPSVVIKHKTIDMLEDDMVDYIESEESCPNE